MLANTLISSVLLKMNVHGVHLGKRGNRSGNLLV